MEKADSKIHFIDLWLDTKILGHKMTVQAVGPRIIETDRWLPRTYPNCYFAASYLQEPGGEERRHVEPESDHEILYRAYGTKDALYSMYWDLESQAAICRLHHDGSKLTLKDEFYRRLDQAEPDTFHKYLIGIVHFRRLHG